MPELTDEQIKAIKIAEKLSKEKYHIVIGTVRQLYLTPPEVIDRWDSYSATQKRANLPEQLEILEGRWKKDIGELILAEYPDGKYKQKVVDRILKMAIERGDITQEERDREKHYRDSVMGKMSNERLRLERREVYAIAFQEGEKRLLEELVGNNDYRHPIGHNRAGFLNWRKIAERINGVYGMGRGPEAFKEMHRRLIKRGTNEEQ